MSEKLILTIDLGTQSLRAGLFNKKGETVALVKVAYNPPYITDHNGGAEQDADFYFNALCEATNKLKKANPNAFSQIAAITLDTVRDTAVMLDANYKPLHRCVIWLDQRLASAKGYNSRPLSHRILFRLVGMKSTLLLNAHKSISLWYQENVPDLWAKCKYYGNISSYLTYCLTGEWADSSASIIGHFPLDFKKRCYYRSKRSLKNLFNVPIDMMPRLIQPGGILGKITPQSSQLTGIPVGTPLISCGSDKSCESLGVGALKPDVAALSYGTASTVEVTVPRYIESEPFLPAYPSCLPGYFNMDVQIYRGYWMINWFIEDFCHYDISTPEKLNKILKQFNQEMLDVPPGCDGLILQPYWQPGLAKPSARGAVIGFTDAHTYAHFYRAIIEGIAFALRDSLEHFEMKTHRRVKQIMLSGGGSQSPEICQITANLFGLPVSRVQTFETSSLGAAIAGFIAVGEFKNPEEAVAAMVHKKDTFEPNMDIHKVYDDLFRKAYKKIYPCLKKIYKSI